MIVDIRLLGPPAITRGDVPIRLAGRKPWALLAMLVLDPGPASRRDLMGRLTRDAGDPQAALRWLLHQVRRALEPEARIVEEQSRLRLEADGDVAIDVTRLLAGDGDPEAVAADIGGELLEGIDFDDAPALDLWLSLERARVHGVAVEALWWAATRLADTDPDRAMRIVRQGLHMDPYCDTKHELMIDLHLRAGDVLAAQRHAAAVERLYRDDLGIAAPDWVRRPLDRLQRRPDARGPGTAAPATARALIRSATARLYAGDAARALETARRGLTEAAADGDPALEVPALLTLSRAIVQTGRAPVAEAKGLLTRAARLALEAGDHAAVADAQREAGVALLAEGNLGAAEAALGRSAALAARLGDEARVGQARTYRGVVASDRCQFEVAIERLRGSLAVFDRLGDVAWYGYAEAMLARSLANAGRPADARGHARAAIARLGAAGWVAVLPWAMLAEADAAVGLADHGLAEDLFADVLALALENGDPTTEGLALHGLAGCRLAAGDRAAALGSLNAALAAVQRFGDGHAWATATILTDLVELEDGGVADHVQAAIALATEGPYPDLAERLGRWRDQRSQTRRQTVNA